MGSNAGTRRFEYKDDKSSKFWEICVEGNGFTVRYGKIGAEGQTQSKEFVDAATTEKQAQKLITEKTGKGYQEVSAKATVQVPIETGATTAKPTEADLAPAPKKTKPAKATKPADIAKDPASTAEALEPLAPQLPGYSFQDPSFWRRFELRDGASSKFWEILVTNNRFEVRYGRIGTEGQKQTKEFDNSEKARKQAEKLIFEKISKGYFDVSAVDHVATSMGNNRTNSISALVEPIQGGQASDVDANHRRHIETIMQLADSSEDENLKKAVEVYANNSRPYCIPKFLPFDLNNPQHRIDDQIFCGFPFTSAKWPWPKGGNGSQMQPIAQINLNNAGKLLGLDLGDGLLQVWGDVGGNGFQYMEERVIPADDLAEPMDNYYPEAAPWLDKDLSFEGCVVKSITWEEEHENPFRPELCRIEWVSAGRMFYGTIMRCLDAELFERLQSDGLYDEIVSLDERLAVLPIPSSNNLNVIYGAKPLAHLGGYQEDYADVWENYSNPRQILLWIPEDGWECIGVTFEHQADNKLEFIALASSSY